MNNEIWKKYDIWLNVAVFLAIVTALLYFVVLPMRQNVFDSADNLKKNKVDNEMDAARVSKIPEMEKVHAVIAEKKNNLNVVLENNSELLLIEELESLAGESGNEISLQVEAVSSDDATKKVPAKTAKDKKDAGEKIEVFDIPRLIAHISLSGRYEQMLDFLNKLENMNYTASVVALDLKKEVAKEDKIAVADGVSNIGGSGVPQVKAIAVEKEILKSNIDVVVYLKN